eukprot:10795451-Heterocapsa_arctica.AAC.1
MEKYLSSRRVVLRLRRVVQKYERFSRHPVAIARGLPYTPVPLYPYTPMFGSSSSSSSSSSSC